MSLSIQYNDSPGLTVYAFLFSAEDKSKAFNISLGSFEDFDLTRQVNFAILLDENPNRVGFYSAEITNVEGIPESAGDSFYLIEVFKVNGSSFDRSSDTLLGTQHFYWDGEKEVPLGGEEVSIDLSSIPAAVWAYSQRTLTQSLECPDNSEELEDLEELIEQKTQEIIDLIKQHDAAQGVLPNVQVPKLGPKGSSGGSGGIRLSR